MNKRGFELAISTIILLILAVFVLVIFVLFLTMGSNNFRDTLKGYFSYSNVDSVISSCNLAVDTNMPYKYCCEKNNLRYYLNGEKMKGNFTCFELLNESFANNLKLMECSSSC